MATKPMDPDAMRTQADHAGKLAKATRRVDEALNARDRVIVDAIVGGLSLRQVAHATGLSHSQVALIARRQPSAHTDRG